MFSFRQISEYYKIVKRNEAWIGAVGNHLGEAWDELWSDSEKLSKQSEEEAIKFQLESKRKLDEAEGKLNTTPIEDRVKLIRRPIAKPNLPW